LGNRTVGPQDRHRALHENGRCAVAEASSSLFHSIEGCPSARCAHERLVETTSRHAPLHLRASESIERDVHVERVHVTRLLHARNLLVTPHPHPCARRGLWMRGTDRPLPRSRQTVRGNWHGPHLRRRAAAIGHCEHCRRDVVGIDYFGVCIPCLQYWRAAMPIDLPARLWAQALPKRTGNSVRHYYCRF
jgi:hypothetical protein